MLFLDADAILRSFVCVGVLDCVGKIVGLVVPLIPCYVGSRCCLPIANYINRLSGVIRGSSEDFLLLIPMCFIIDTLFISISFQVNCFGDQPFSSFFFFV